MSTVNTSLRLQEDLFHKVKEEAKFNGVSFNSFVANLLANKIQDEEDYHEAMMVLKENNQTISRDEMLKRYE
ncbi:MAG: DUF6290 family protein [Coriobacteriia bacterium]|nr:DUF6290 family protein [Coriobacteriia bacterium]MCL2745699.1 DUF6290 family protein [Coriobacteriia bacterium]MCL2870451.1 DUF6290 family protein [Coriobacteriia bacterium]